MECAVLQPTGVFSLAKDGSQQDSFSVPKKTITSPPFHTVSHKLNTVNSFSVLNKDPSSVPTKNKFQQNKRPRKLSQRDLVS